MTSGFCFQTLIHKNKLMNTPKISWKLVALASALSIGVAPGVLTETARANEPITFQPIASQELAQVTGDIVTVLNEDPDFGFLVTALQTADMVSTLQGPGPYTVFAPSDFAFDALPSEVVDFLLMPENQDVLRAVLAYHVAPGELTLTDLSTGPLETLSGETVAVDYDDPDAVAVNEADIVVANVPATNGVVHYINKVLLPDNVVMVLQDELGIDPTPTRDVMTPTPTPTPTQTPTPTPTPTEPQTQAQPQTTPTEDTTQPVRGLW
jgi:uncharacterized surface protein with fasciclin (FAS1) repeats